MNAKIPQDLENHLISLPLTLKRITVSDNQVTTQVKDEEGVHEVLPSFISSLDFSLSLL
ncbi:Second part of one of two inversely orientated ORFs in ISC1043 [Saccharolobus solfataricus P2]|uniref:Second part of one of two inversely orientated ORFs in ISC1043 n=2 Tax=Saccharolobus solfataricus TaxID=2287 RepID=Q97Y61_SACS2|nr:Second part of one of two inversely orientated ORFs in ISC1043 [Saccharolobus solfataricus P2]SAI85184.1 ORFs in transposon ISC1043 [Saccharolobus solfataricus]